jgi:hypothetical protein
MALEKNISDQPWPGRFASVVFLSVVEVRVPERDFWPSLLQQAMHLIVVILAQRHQMADRLFADSVIASMVQAVVNSVAYQAFLGHARELPSRAHIGPVGRLKVFVVGDEPEIVQAPLQGRLRCSLKHQ